MTPADIHPVPLFILGLCRAAADVRDTREDTGEYE